ncbi:MAG TPA: TM1812 family CRISPR-associated protein, partial [Methanospirillum sp.]|nr:TM1812 family CRISPR-associated protein [Methanospirillum sp.]
MNHADAREIRTLVQKIAAAQFLSSGGKEGPTQIAAFAGKLEGFTSAVRLSRPVEGIAYARSIGETLPAVEEESGQYTPALKPVIGRLAAISRFSTAYPDLHKGPCQDHIRTQLELISYQIEQGLYPQAVTLAREWMVTVLICAVGAGSKWLDRSVRAEAERTLSGGALKAKGSWYELAEYSDWFESRNDWKEYSKTWDRITDIRNDIAHCGMNDKEQKASKLELRVKNIKKDLSSFADTLLPTLHKH